MMIIFAIMVAITSSFKVDLLSRNEFGGPYFGSIFLGDSVLRVVFDSGS